MLSRRPANAAWPELPVQGWQPTRDTLMLWLQLVGTVRIARAPLPDLPLATAWPAGATGVSLEPWPLRVSA